MTCSSIKHHISFTLCEKMMHRPAALRDDGYFYHYSYMMACYTPGGWLQLKRGMHASSSETFGGSGINMVAKRDQQRCTVPARR